MENHQGGNNGEEDEPSNDFYDEDNEDVPPQNSASGGGGGILMGGITPQGNSGSGGGGLDFGGAFSCHLQGAVGGCVPEELEKNLDDASNLLESESGLFQQRMWGCFQNCARAVAQVYMSNKQATPPPSQEQPNAAEENQQNQSFNSHQQKQLEESFKSAAQHATSLYKDSIETSRRLIDLSIKTGSNRRTKEILSFVKSRKKRFIKRDDLINYLIGGSSSGSGGGGGRKDSTGGAGTGSRGGKHVHFGGTFTMGVSGGGGGVAGLFEGIYPFGMGNPGLPHPQVYHVHPQQQQGHIGSPFGGVFPTQQPPLQPPTHLPHQQQTTNAQRDVPSPTHPFSLTNSSSSSSSSNLFVRTGTPPALYNPGSRASADDTSLLHLAVQQLFVAGSTAVGTATATPHDYPHVAGVKRPAPDRLLPVKEEQDSRGGNELGAEGGSRNRSNQSNNNNSEGIDNEDEDDDDLMMEDSVDGESASNFKRMRFY